MYLVDTDVISELRKKATANPGVVAFFKDVSSSDAPLYLAAVTIGELRRGGGTRALSRRRQTGATA